MADVPESLQTIKVEEVAYRGAVSENTLTKIGGVINSFIKTGTEAIGTVVQSFLTEAQFQTIRGTNWVRMNGQDITGSDFANLTGITTLPAVIGNKTFFRQCDEDESNLLSLQSSQNKSHAHVQQISLGVNDLPWSRDAGGSSGGLYNVDFVTNIASSDANSVISTVSEGGSEVRVVNYPINFFIKINN